MFAIVDGTTTTLVRTPRSGGLATVIAQLPGIVATGLTVDVAGLIDIAHGDEILQVNPDTGATETVRSNVLEVSAVARSAGDRIAMLAGIRTALATCGYRRCGHAAATVASTP